MKQTQDHIDIISRAIDEPEPLAEWEYDFINRLADKSWISDKEEIILFKIGKKYDDD